ncbi:Multidrug export protein MepA [bioreactor metagenome]|uniref:Multidrug export protein MepA n=1 Tax=bioreactor metagenome TaxID=1076179 RepID=A0A644YFV3_9ZZZZ
MPVPKALANLAVPTILSQLVTMIYNLADTYFVGRTNNPYMVAAVSVAYTLFFVLNALSNLFGVGGGSLVSRLLGVDKPGDAKKVSSFSFYATIVVAFFYSMACLGFMNPLLRLLGASDNTILYARQYLFWVVVVGGIPTMMGMTMAHLLRSAGYAKQASFGLALGGMLNIGLDPLFMFRILPRGMEVAGAAAATMLSNIVALIYFFTVFARLRGMTVLSIKPGDALPDRKYLGPIFAVGFPSAIGSLLACVSNMLINHLASGYGDIPVAAFGIVKKIDMLPMNVGMGLCQGMMPLVAYNYAAKNYKRMREAANFARLCGIGFAIACIVSFEVFSVGLVRVFISDAETVQMGASFLRIACLATPFMIINFQMSYTFQAMGKGKQSLILSSSRQGIINIPLLFAMNIWFGLYGIIWTQLLADAVTLVISFGLYFRLHKQMKLEESRA